MPAVRRLLLISWEACQRRRRTGARSVGSAALRVGCAVTAAFRPLCALVSITITIDVDLHLRRLLSADPGRRQALSLLVLRQL